jgi:hypothetical protein
MTGVSHLLANALPQHAESALRRRIGSIWHVLCIFPFVSGCFYFLPLDRIEENMPPEILASSPAAGEPVVLSLPVNRVFVLIDEPDGDDIACQWSIDSVGDLGPGDPTQSEDIKGCQISLGQESDYNDRTLTVRVFDLPARDMTDQSWEIELPEEGT